MNNDHLVLSDNLESNKINVNLSVLIDIDVIDYAFIDDSFAQSVRDLPRASQIEMSFN